jgi:hypothetical protein
LLARAFGACFAFSIGFLRSARVILNNVKDLISSPKQISLSNIKLRLCVFASVFFLPTPRPKLHQENKVPSPAEEQVSG